jgi:WD40 repeat protein
MQPIRANPGPRQVPFMDQDRGVVVKTLSSLDIWSIGAFSLVCKDWKELLEDKYQGGNLSLWQIVALSQLPSIDLERIPDLSSYLRIDSNLVNGLYSKKRLAGARHPIIVKGPLLFSAKANCNPGQVLKWDWKNENCTGSYIGHAAKIESIALSENAEHLFSRDSKGTVKKWDTEKRTCLATCEDEAYSDPVLVLTADNRFFTNSPDGSIKVWNAVTCDHIGTIANPFESWTSVSSWAVDTDKRRLCVAYSGGQITVLDLDDLSSRVATHQDHSSIRPMIIKGSKVFFGCVPGYHSLLKSWDYEKNSSAVVLGRHGRFGRPVAINEATGMLFSGIDCDFQCLRVCRIDDLKTTRGSNSVLIRTHYLRMNQLLEKDGVVFSANCAKVKILDFTETRRRILEDVADAMMNKYSAADPGDMEAENQGVLIKEDTEGKYGGVWEEEGGDGSVHESESCSSDSEEEGSFPLVHRQFSRLPLAIQEAVFAKLDEILQQQDPYNYNGNPVDAFYNKNGQTSTHAHRSKAMWAVLGGQVDYSDDNGSGDEQEYSEDLNLDVQMAYNRVFNDDNGSEET